MICINDDELGRRALLLRSWGRTSSLFVQSESIETRFNVELDGIPYDAKFLFEELGYNLEPSEIGAAFGLVQLDKLDRNIAAREHNFKRQPDFFSRYRSEEHTSELQSLMRNSYSGLCLKKNKNNTIIIQQ